MDGTEYRGEWLNDQRHGQGNSVYPNGDRYEGGWVEGKRRGLGTVSYSDGGTYHGEFQEDAAHVSEEQLLPPHGVKDALNVYLKRVTRVTKSSSKIAP